ncbi:MAG: dihydropteroate synthase [bacterium]
MKKVYLLNPLNVREVISLFKSLSVHHDGIDIMQKKSMFYTFMIKSLSAPAANILKQEALAAGAELATAWSVIKDSNSVTDAVLMGTYRQIELIANKIASQQFGLSSIAGELMNSLQNLFHKHYLLKYRDSMLDFFNGPKLMGILNVTPDSFYDGGRFFSVEAAVEHGVSLCEAGADIIDIGGESTRPGSEPVDSEEEKKRVIPVIRQLRKKVSIPISIDTMKADVATEALENGADIVNDISAMSFDDKMSEVVKKYRAGVILMHMQGTPKSMQLNPQYNDVVAEILNYLNQRAEFAMEMGIEKEYIAVDPGIGFGKTVHHNLLILKHIKAFKALGFALAIGTSRKSFIGKLTDTEVNDRLWGSLATAIWSATQGVDIIRVHDIKETRYAMSILKHIMDA